MARIVIIEDNATNLGLMSYLLTAFGHTVEGYRDGQSGLDAVRASPPDIVLCDVQLPRLSGYGVAKALKSAPALSGLPVVAVTALAMRGDREQVVAAGFDGYIEKPLDPESFASQVEAYLAPKFRNGPRKVTPQAAPAPAPKMKQVVSQHRTLLVVDDLEENASLMRAIFEGSGFRVLMASDMHKGLDLMREHEVDLVISDVHMLAGDGFRFRRAAQAIPGLAAIPFIFVSSSVVNDRDRDEAERLGVCRLLERPIEPPLLVKAVAECLTRAADQPRSPY